MHTLEGQVVQDADRLDAIGAIGIARAFAYGGHDGRALTIRLSGRSSTTRSRLTSEQWTDDQPLLRKAAAAGRSHEYGRAKRLARERHALMEDFLEHFYREWEGR